MDEINEIESELRGFDQEKFSEIKSGKSYNLQEVSLTRSTADGPQFLNLEIYDYGISAGISRYLVTVSKLDSDNKLTGNHGRTIREALLSVHWHKLN